MQVAVAIRKILYAADVKESALEEAQAYLQQAMNVEHEDEEQHFGGRRSVNNRGE